MAVCRVCVGVLDAVVTEWRRGESPGDEGAVCVACGAPAQLWVSPAHPPPDAVIAVHMTGPILRIEVSGSLSADAGEIVARELAALSERREPVVVDLHEVTDLDEGAERSLETAVATVLGAGVHVGIVGPAGSRWAGGLARRFAGGTVAVAGSLAAVLNEMADISGQKPTGYGARRSIRHAPSSGV